MKLHQIPGPLRLVSLEERAHAGLCVTSLPWPKEPVPSLSLGGRTAGVLPLGRWPKSEAPRRLLLFADNEGAPPASLLLGQGGGTGAGPGAVPTATMEPLERYESRFYQWERHFLRLRGHGRSIGLALGLRRGEAIHWWEACGLTVLRENSRFAEIEMAGSIAVEQMSEEEFLSQTGYHNRYLHRHNWISGHLYARLHANGVCEIYAHHINNKFVDDGGAFEHVVPVIGFLAEGEAPPECDAEGPWDGSREEAVIGGVRFDLREAARLATPRQPGRLFRHGRLLVWQPYAGVDLYGGLCPEALTGDPFLFRAETESFPKGMARTLRFSLSLSGRSPVVARYLAPAWWYGVCEEFLPEPLLPVSNDLDQAIGTAQRWARESQWQGGFEDGTIPRHIWSPRTVHGETRHEAGWEGEISYAWFLSAWRRGCSEAYHGAMRAAYCFADTCIDHASKLVRMHGFAPPALALPMNRVQGPIAAYLETGDRYLFEAARAVTANAHWQHLNSWPRMAVGRDACYVRSAVLLYRYFGDDFFASIALEGALAVAQTQRPNGSFGDQGGGAGIHQWSGYISKPWMGLLALGGVLDYLELFPGEPRLEAAVRKFADWLMDERWEQGGARVWSYQHDYCGRHFYFNPIDGSEVPLPTRSPWHHASLARLLGFCALTFGERAYLDAWAESWAATPQETGDHASAAVLQFIPWLQAKLWNARLCAGRVEVCPFDFGAAFPREAVLLTPEGPLPVTRQPHPAAPALAR